jgi:succinate-semialdehyde dehydrogenase/glutarate-semialdehyde dehydrogenase
MTYQTINPATGEVLQTFSEISNADLEIAMGRAHTCYETDWGHRPVRVRSSIAAAKMEKCIPVSGLSQQE